MAVGDVYEVTVSMTVRGQYCNNVFKVREAVEEAAEIPAQSIALGFRDAMITDWKALLSNEVTFECVYVRRISPAPGVAYTVLLTDVGAVAEESIPTTSALICTWLSNLASKRGRGRTYFVGLPETAQAGGKLEADLLDEWEDFTTTLLTQFPGASGDATGEFALCVWSEVNGTAQDVKQRVVRTNLGTMATRRQRPGTS